MNTTQPKTFFKSPLWLGSHLALLIVLLLWFIPITHSFCQNIDNAVFRILNGSLANHIIWENFWGILNHRREVTLNLVFAALFNLWAILQTKDVKLRKIRIKQIFYFWTFFQIGVMLQDVLFNSILQVTRDSPSLILKPVIKLSEILHNPDIKDTSTHSFPGGHAFAMIYWAAFTWLIGPKYIAKFGLFFAIILCLPRLFSGAHWLSDIIFSALMALVWLSWTISIPLYRKFIYPNKYL
jgi:membrane-associated phospholipid phosphatase